MQYFDISKETAPPPGAMESTFTFIFGLSHLADPSAVHPSRGLTSGAASFDGVCMQVLGQPPQVAIANERVACKVPVKTKNRNIE